MAGKIAVRGFGFLHFGLILAPSIPSIVLLGVVKETLLVDIYGIVVNDWFVQVFCDKVTFWVFIGE